MFELLRYGATWLEAARGTVLVHLAQPQTIACTDESVASKKVRGAQADNGSDTSRPTVGYARPTRNRARHTITVMRP